MIILKYIFRHIHQIQEAFDPLHAESKGVGILDASDIISLSYALSNMGESLRDRLLGNLGRAVGHNDVHFPEETRTPGEKMALQVHIFYFKYLNNIIYAFLFLKCKLS